MLDREPENPIVSAMERTGYPDGKEPEYPKCPVCREECETVYRDSYGTYVGCDVCLEEKDAWKVKECFRQDWGSE